MAGHTQRDLTTGSIPRHVVALAWPAILSTMVHNLYGLNDVFFSQYTGLAGQTAVSNNLFVFITIFGFIQLSFIGTQTLVARRTGARNEAGADRAARQGLLLSLALSLVLGVAGFFTAPWIPRLMGMDAEVSAASIRYLQILFLGLPALFVFPAVESIFRARGDTKTPLWLQIAVVATNIVGNYLSVFVLDVGVAGIAASTIVSRAVGIGIGMRLLRAGRVGLPLARHEGRLLDLPLWRRIVRLSAPIGARTMLFGFVYQIVARIAADFGTAAQNGLGVGIRVEGMCFFVLVGFGLAAGPTVGQNLGAGRPDRAARAAWTVVAMAMVPSLLFTGVFLGFPTFFMRIFAQDPTTIALGADYLRIVAACFVFLNLEVVLAHAFVGAGDTMPPMVVDVPITALRVPLCAWLAHDLGWGIDGIFWAISGTAIVRGLAMAIWFARGRWKRARPDLDA